MWNLALDEKGTPYIGVREEGDIIPGAPTTGRGSSPSIARRDRSAVVDASGRLRTIRNTCAAKVFATSGVAESAAQPSKNPVSHVGFRNPDGSYVVVLSNRGSEKRVQLVLGSSSLLVELPADSVHTLQWST